MQNFYFSCISSIMLNKFSLHVIFVIIITYFDYRVAGYEECVSEYSSIQCPRGGGGCPFEYRESKVNHQTVTELVSVSGGLAGIIKEMAVAKFGAGYLSKRASQIKIRRSSKVYGVLPPGNIFCSFIKATRNGRRWDCSVPLYYQVRLNQGFCTSLPTCDKCSSKDSGGRLSAMLLHCMVITVAGVLIQKVFCS